MALMCKITRQSFTHAAVGRRRYGSSVRSGRGGTVCVFFPFQAKKKIDGNAEALGGCCRFWAGSGGGLSDSTGRRTDGGTGGMWWLFLSLSRSRTHTHTHTQELKESGKMIAGMVSRDGNTESCLSLRFGPWWSGGLGGGRFWALSFWESLKY